MKGRAYLDKAGHARAWVEYDDGSRLYWYQASDRCDDPMNVTRREWLYAALLALPVAFIGFLFLVVWLAQ